VNLLEYRTAIERRSGVALDSRALTELVNEALQAVSTEYDWPWLTGTRTFTTQPDVTTYPMPFDANRIRYVTVNGDEITKRRIIDLDIGRCGWTVHGDQLVLSPVPSAATPVLVRYHGTESDLASDTDSPALPPEYDHAVIEFALMRVADRADESNTAAGQRKAERAQKAYDGWIRRMRRGCQRTAGPIAPRVRPGSAI
jgi:hypothetical protein